MNFDSRLDKRSYKEMGENIDKWEPLEEKAVQIFQKVYINNYGGDVKIVDFGFRRKGLELNVDNIDIEPDFKISFEKGPFEGKAMTIEIQAMEPDYKQFHIKKHKVNKAINTNSLFLHMSAIGRESERFIVLKPKSLEEFVKVSIEKFGVVGFPGTICPEFPLGKPCYRFRDDWFTWNFTNKIAALYIH